MISAVKSFYFLEEHDALGGLEKVGTMLDKARYSNSLSSKLTAHLQRINSTDLKLQVPKQQNSLEETQQWLTEGGVISAVKSFYFLEEHDALGGLEKVGTMLDKARYSNSLSSKLTAHLQRINSTDHIPYIQYDTKHGKGGI